MNNIPSAPKILPFVTDVKLPENRISWVDNVKMVAMLFVIMGHTWRIIHCPLPEWLSLFILSFNMALFVIMTGYTSIKALDKNRTVKDLWTYVLKITKRVLIPSLVMTLIFGVGTILYKVICGDLGSIIKLAGKVALIVSYVLAYLYRDTEKGKKVFDLLCIIAIPLALKLNMFWFFSMIWSVCVSAAFAMFLISKTSSAWGGYALLYLFAFGISLFMNVMHDKTSDFVHFFLIGYALGKFGVIQRLNSFIFALISLGIGLAIVSSVDEDVFNFWDEHFIEFVVSWRPQFYVLRIIASALIGVSFMITIKMCSKEYGLFSFWGSQTLALYIVHAIIITICYRLPIHYSLDGLWYLAYAIPMTMIIATLSIIIIKILMRYDITRAFCLGEIR